MVAADESRVSLLFAFERRSMVEMSMYGRH